MSWLPKRSSAREPANPSAGSLESIVDELLESYARACEACEDVRGAYESWRTCGPPQRLLGSTGIAQAVDREEAAARVHSKPVERLRTAMG